MTVKKITSAALTLILFFCLSVNALAAQWPGFSDVSGHWAEETLRRGFDDGLIAGMDETTLAPNTPITTAQMITILCRVLNATEKADIASLNIPADAWYEDAAGKALKLGLIGASTGALDAPMTRQNAVSMMARAFCLVPAEPDLAQLNAFSDNGKISAENIGAMAALVSDGLVQGFSGSLNVDDSITRAEFLTVLYRVANNYISADALSSGAQGGSVIKGSGFLSYLNIGKIWFDCASESVTLSGVTADTVTLRSHRLNSLGLYSTNISRLVVAVGSGNVLIDGNGSAQLGSVSLAACSGASVGADADSIELTGSGIPVNITGRHTALIITGDGNTVTLASGATLGRLKITGKNNNVKCVDAVSGSVSCPEIELIGSGNTVSINSTTTEPAHIAVGGSGNRLDGSFSGIAELSVSGTKGQLGIVSLSDISAFSVSGSENKIDVSGASPFALSVSGSLNDISLKSASDMKAITVTGNANWLGLVCGDIPSVILSGNYNTFSKQGTGSVVSAEVPGGNNALIITAENWLEDAEISGLGNSLTVDGAAGTITLSGRKTILSGSGKVINLNINAGGCTVTLQAENAIDNSGQAEEGRVLNLVTLGYKGNFTLKWAQTHDYETYEKELWVNAKDYTSATEYLIWVNLAMQRVNIFSGSAGNWTLINSCIVGTGAPGRGTPVGVWKTTYKTIAGWTTGSYTVKPVVGFKQNTGYAFHSRLYYPGTSTLSDHSIGFPVSHGCVRMYDDDIMYIYNNIPIGTTVVVY